MQAGDTFIRAGKHVKTDPHLWVIISDPAKNSSVVTVNVTSQHIEKDQSCVIQSGEHSFVTKESVILYPEARVVLKSQILSGIQSGLLKNHNRVSQPLLARIRTGAAKTKDLPLAAKRMLQAQAIIPTPP